MTAFEQGYRDFLLGKKVEENPFDLKDYPYTARRWNDGWLSARLRKIEKAL